MSSDYVLIKGNEAIAEAALRAGCRFYAGYPITPQSEILEYMSAHMAERGGTFIQGENEVASMSMLFGAAMAGARAMSSSSGPGFDLKQEEMSYLKSSGLPAVLCCAMRYGAGDGMITPGQDSYWVTTKGGGHGDGRQIVLAPASVDECAQLTYEAFDLADKYRNVVIILTDGAISQMIEKCHLPEPKEHDIDQFDWAVKGRPLGEPKMKKTNLLDEIGNDGYTNFMRDKIRLMAENEQRWEEVETEDAELILVAYGISSRVCKTAVKQAREQGVKLGLIRPISVWPFPKKAFAKVADGVKLATVEMSITALLGRDVKEASEYRLPVYSYLTDSSIPLAEDVVAFAKDVLAGKVDEMEVF